MTYPSISPIVQLIASAGQINFDGNFKLFETSDVKVYLTPVGNTPDPAGDLLTENVNYTIAISGDGLTFTMSLIVAATLNDIITMQLDIANSRTTDYSVGGTFTSSALNLQLDKLTALISQVNAKLTKRGLLYNVTDQLDVGDLTIPELSPNEVWQANAAGNIAAVECIEETCSTLRNQLASETDSAPGSDNIGIYNGYYGGGQTLTESLIATRPSNRVFTTTGTANTYILTSPITAKTSLEAGDTMVIQLNETNVDGDVTFNLDGIGAVEVFNNLSRTFSAGELQAFVLYQFVYDGSIFRLLSQYRSSDNQLPVKSTFGYLLSNNAADSQHDIDITTGACKDASMFIDLTFRGSFTKKLDAAWALGTGNGGMAPPTTIGADAWYDLYVIMGATDRQIDFGFDIVCPPTNLLTASGATYYQYLGTVFTDGSSNIKQFIQTGRTFMFKTPIINYTAANPGNAAVLATLDVPKVEKKVMAHLNFGMAAGTNDQLAYVSDPETTDMAPSEVATPLGNVWAPNAGDSFTQIDVVTSNQQIRFRLSGSNAATGIVIVTRGYTDFVGQ